MINREAFLKAVAEVETGGNTRAVGRRGERGLYQFSYATWRRHSSRPFTEAHNPSVAHDVAVRHFVWLHDKLATSGREPDAFQMAVAWNGGVGRAISGQYPRATRSYATRVSNIAAVIPTRTAPVAVVRHTPTPRSSRPRATSTPSVRVARPVEAQPIRFDYQPEEIALATNDAPVVALEETVSEDVPFSLSSPRGEAATTNTTSGHRVIFATIGD